MNITDNGTYVVGAKAAQAISILCSGSLGGATITIGYLLNQDDLESFIPVPESSAVNTEVFSQVFTKGINTTSAVKVENGTSIDIEVYSNTLV